MPIFRLKLSTDLFQDENRSYYRNENFKDTPIFQIREQDDQILVLAVQVISVKFICLNAQL